MAGRLTAAPTSLIPAPVETAPLPPGADRCRRGSDSRRVARRRPSRRRDRIAAWAESAGGHFADLLEPGMLWKAMSEITVPATHVSAVVHWYAPSDLATVATDARTDLLDETTRDARLLGAPVVSVAELAAQASPLHHVRGRAPPSCSCTGRPTVQQPPPAQ